MLDVVHDVVHDVVQSTVQCTMQCTMSAAGCDARCNAPSEMRRMAVMHTAMDRAPSCRRRARPRPPSWPWPWPGPRSPTLAPRRSPSKKAAADVGVRGFAGFVRYTSRRYKATQLFIQNLPPPLLALPRGSVAGPASLWSGAWQLRPTGTNRRAHARPAGQPAAGRHQTNRRDQVTPEIRRRCNTADAAATTARVNNN